MLKPPVVEDEPRGRDEGGQLGHQEVVGQQFAQHHLRAGHACAAQGHRRAGVEGVAGVQHEQAQRAGRRVREQP
ncbi:hypothetical protein [Actinosynnema mirum]|uniref:hypothetical protein n=1 Tax=Actinosynnema mirum TaxID=40567 RepID=UPI00019ACB10|nr:hypothetical protein [Actinosynnema mirum]